MNTAWTNQYLLGQFGRAAAILHHGLALIGLVAVLLLVVRGKSVFFENHFEGHANRSATIGSIHYDSAVSVFEGAQEADGEKYRALANYVSRRYRIASDVTEVFVGAAHEAGREVGLDPLLILAVMAVESRFNPVAESLVGAKGLMQVIPQYHMDKLMEQGGAEAVLDPVTNIALGARILKEYIRRTGSLEAGLQFYNGALADPTSQYAQKVLAEKERLQQAVRVPAPRPPARNSV